MSTFLYRNGRRCPWDIVRAYVLRRDSYTCQHCGGLADEVDHIWPRRWGGEDNLENLQALCGPCNRTKGVSLDVTGATDDQMIAALRLVSERLFADLDGPGERIAAELRRRSKEGDGFRAACAIGGLRAAMVAARSQVECWMIDLPEHAEVLA